MAAHVSIPGRCNTILHLVPWAGIRRRLEIRYYLCHTINCSSRDSSILLTTRILYQINEWNVAQNHTSLFGRLRLNGSDVQPFQTKRCCFKECCCMLFDIPFGNGCDYFCGYFAMSMECIPPRPLLELVGLLGPPRLVKSGTLQCQRNAFHQETCLNWFGFWGPQDFWKSSGRALKNVEKTAKPMWLNIWPQAYLKLGWNIWLGWVLCRHELLNYGNVTPESKLHFRKCS